MTTGYYYRVVFADGSELSNPEWSEKNARSHAAFHKPWRGAGDIQRARKYPGAHRGPWEPVPKKRR